MIADLPPAFPVERATLERMESMARGYWARRHIEPCLRITVREETYWTAANGDERWASADTRNGRCGWNINTSVQARTTQPEYRCYMAIHELGHLAGLGHGGRFRVMDGERWRIPPACWTRAGRKKLIRYSISA